MLGAGFCSFSSMAAQLCSSARQRKVLSIVDHFLTPLCSIRTPTRKPEPCAEPKPTLLCAPFHFVCTLACDTSSFDSSRLSAPTDGASHRCSTRPDRTLRSRSPLSSRFGRGKPCFLFTPSQIVGEAILKPSPFQSTAANSLAHSHLPSLTTRQARRSAIAERELRARWTT